MTESVSLDTWLRFAAITFGMWSFMIPIGIMIIRGSVEKLTQSQEKFQIELHQYMMTMEKRVSLIEADHRVLASRLDAFHQGMVAAAQKTNNLPSGK